MSPASKATAAVKPSVPDRAPLKVLIADKFEASGIEALEEAGCAVELKPEVASDALAETIKDADPEVLIVRGKKVPGAVFAQPGALSLVVRAGAGYDTIDVEAASAKGVFVANCPGKNAIAVAELVWAHILNCDRRVADQAADLKAGAWNKKEYAEAQGLFGRTLGIVGLGPIGLAVAERGRAFGMKVVAWSRSLTQEKADEAGVDYCSKLINLARMADVISINVAATTDTAHLINSQFCEALKPGAIVINSSRGSVVDEAALAKAIREKQVRAGLDVFADEPAGGTGTFADTIVKERGVWGTHHIGASTNQAQQAIADEVVRIVKTYRASGVVLNCVNRAAPGATAAKHLLTVRHLNRPGVLAHVFYTLGQAGINVEEMENIVYAGAQAACARIQLDDCPTRDHLNTIRKNENVLGAAVNSLATPA
jgi:D-3-phosphoglycerate dehydrogenase